MLQQQKSDRSASSSEPPAAGRSPILKVFPSRRGLRGAPRPFFGTEVAWGSPMTILLIDDDAAMRAMLTDFLARRRIAVVADANGADALARLQREHVDAVVVDKEMAGMNGL